MLGRDEFIVEVWERIGNGVVGANELTAIQNAVVEKFGSAATVSPALIARTLADQGARLRHPEILQTDSRWREQRPFFTADDLAFDTLEAALALVEKVQQADPMSDRLRYSVQQLKTELDAHATSQTVSQKRRELAREVAQWLTLWLQNPRIFPEWLVLRRSTPEFQQLFGTFARS